MTINGYFEQIIKWIIGISIALFAVLLLWNIRIDSDPDHILQKSLYSHKNYEDLLAATEKLGSTYPKQNETIENFYSWQADVRIAYQTAKHFQEWGYDNQEGLSSLILKLEQIENHGADIYMPSRFNLGITDQAQRDFFRSKLEQVRIKPQFRPILPLFGLWYLVSSMLIFLYLIVKAINRNYSLLAEFLTVTRLPLAIFAWPVTVSRYPFGEPLDSLRHSIKMAAYILASILSISAAGGVKGQSKPSKDGSGTQTNSGYIIQTDSRYSEKISGDNPPSFFQQRITVTTPKNKIIENVFIMSDRIINNTIQFGSKVYNKNNLSVNVLFGHRFTKTRNRVIHKNDQALALNIQVFKSWSINKIPFIDRITMSNPVLQIEKAITNAKKVSISFSNQTFLKIKKHNLFPGIEYSASKTMSQKMNWHIGALFEWKPPGKNKYIPRLGIGLIRNQSGTQFLRFRLIETFAF